jgi:uncharacterized protein (DUF1015 family)
VSETLPPLFAPFRGERYSDSWSLARRLAPPYDVIGPEERARLAALDPENVVHVDLPVAPPGGDPYSEAARILGLWRDRGVLARDERPSAYVMRTTTRFEDGGVRARTGVFLALAAEPFATGRVKPHEETHAGPKEDRRRLTLATACNLSPIFVLSPDPAGRLAAALDEVTALRPWASAETVGAHHEVWVVTGERAAGIAEESSRDPVYIADGHHRYETAVHVRGEAPSRWREGATRTLSHVVSFRDPGLEILPTHRIVQGEPVGREALLAATLGSFFARAGGSAPLLTLVFSDGLQVPLVAKSETPPQDVADLPHRLCWGLSSWMCDALLVGAIAARLLAKKPGLRYTPSSSEAVAAARTKGVAFSVLLGPVELERVRLFADSGLAMPPKSTYFAPKVPTGVVLRPLEE